MAPGAVHADVVVGWQRRKRIHQSCTCRYLTYRERNGSCWQNPLDQLKGGCGSGCRLNEYRTCRRFPGWLSLGSQGGSRQQGKGERDVEADTR